MPESERACLSKDPPTRPPDRAPFQAEQLADDQRAKVGSSSQEGAGERSRQPLGVTVKHTETEQHQHKRRSQ